MLKSKRVLALGLSCALLGAPAWAEDDSESKRIEDVVGRESEPPVGVGVVAGGAV